VGRHDFDGTFYQTANVNDKALRAMTTMALTDLCLQKAQPPKSTKSTKKKP